MLVNNCTLWSSMNYSKQNLILSKEKDLVTGTKNLFYAKATKLFIKSHWGDPFADIEGNNQLLILMGSLGLQATWLIAHQATAAQGRWAEISRSLPAEPRLGFAGAQRLFEGQGVIPT